MRTQPATGKLVPETAQDRTHPAYIRQEQERVAKKEADRKARYAEPVSEDRTMDDLTSTATARSTYEFFEPIIRERLVTPEDRKAQADADMKAWLKANKEMFG